ncbi:MAG: hypothetical protein BMS9Abin36_1177 [Gammaproteobacteria bacterium]|nr:MAG: hypothetical protein BMS9Abin36_1177 [Gammaproteobacteria bacterium]
MNNNKLPVYIDGVGVFGPGMTSWNECRAVLRGECEYQPQALPKLLPELLVPAVRRRTGDYIRLAVKVAAEAAEHSIKDASQLATVFATSDSDGNIAHTICGAVVQDEPMVSPTMFHNSVTNSPAGYWCIAVKSQAPSTSVAGYDASFAVGWLEAVTQLAVDEYDAMLVVHDVKMPEPLNTCRPMECNFGIALALSRQQGEQALARVETGIVADTETLLASDQLNTLRLGNPAARGLPLLAAMARGVSSNVMIPYLDDTVVSLKVELLL